MKISLKGPLPILLICDEPSVGLTIRRTLETQGYDIYSAHNSKEALKLLQHPYTPRPGLIIINLRTTAMPVDEFLAESGLHEKDDEVPVLLLSHPEDLILNPNNKPFVVMPIDSRELLKTVNVLFKLKSTLPLFH